MLDRTAIQAILDELHIPLSGEPVQHGEKPDHLYLFVLVHRDGANRQVPSNAKLKTAQKVFLENGVTVDFLLFDGAASDAEAGLRATLIHAFGKEVRNVFLSVEKRGARVWIDPKRQLSDAVRKEISSKAEIFLSELDLRLDSVTSLAGENLPSSFVMLRAIRQLAPIDVASLGAHLESKGFSIPSLDWVNRRLDGLRKSDRVVRLATGQYVLALSCIRELGTTRNSKSPDISRLLALAVARRYPS